LTKKEQNAEAVAKKVKEQQDLAKAATASNQVHRPHHVNHLQTLDSMFGQITKSSAILNKTLMHLAATHSPRPTAPAPTTLNTLKRESITKEMEKLTTMKVGNPELASKFTTNIEKLLDQLKTSILLYHIVITFCHTSYNVIVYLVIR
jgi:hypothetical protein